MGRNENGSQTKAIGGVVHTYQKYDPGPLSKSNSATSQDMVSHAFEHAMMYGKYRELTEEELANAIELDPSQIAGLGPSIDFLRELLEERKRKILANVRDRFCCNKKVKLRTYENSSPRRLRRQAELRGIFKRAVQEEQIYLLERIYYRVGDDTDRFAESVSERD